MPSPDDLIYIKHESLEGLGGPVTRAALDLVYTPRDWREATEDEIDAHLGEKVEKAETIEAIATNPEALDVLTTEIVDGTRKRADLDEIALAKGIDPTLFDNMDALKDAVKATL